MTCTHTYAILEVSSAAFHEIKEKLLAAGYEHAMQAYSGKIFIDMHGLALREEEDQKV